MKLSRHLSSTAITAGQSLDDFIYDIKQTFTNTTPIMILLSGNVRVCGKYERLRATARLVEHRFRRTGRPEHYRINYFTEQCVEPSKSCVQGGAIVFVGH